MHSVKNFMKENGVYMNFFISSAFLHDIPFFFLFLLNLREVVATVSHN